MRLVRRASLPLVLTGLGLACSPSGGGAGNAVNVAVAPSVVFPEGVLDSATTLNLTVYDGTEGGVGCDANGALPTGVTSSTPKVASATLGTTNCTASAKFCGTLTLTRSSDVLVFAAQALDASGAVIANGCAPDTVNQAALTVSITMQRYLTPAVCGNGVIEPTEQCDPPTPEDAGTDPVCSATCQSLEEPLSIGATAPAGPAFFLWPPQSGLSGEMYAFFTEGTSNLDVGLRVMSDSLATVSVPIAAEASLLAPDGTTFPPAPTAGNQSQPTAALVNGLYYYAFSDTSATGSPAISLRAFDNTLSDVGSLVAVSSGSAPQSAPSMAASANGVLFVAWQDTSSGEILGRTYNPAADGGTGLGTQNTLSTGTGNENVQVAATPTGWIAVWDDSTEIKMRVISSTGTPSGGEIAVNGPSHTGTQDHPGVAVLGDGRAAVVWCDHGSTSGDIFVQRYDATLTAVAGDQATAVNDVVTAGEQASPAIAGSSAAGGSFVAAWLDLSTGDVRGAVLGGSSGYLFDPIDGNATEFKASATVDPTRENPVVAIGGAGPWVAIGWDDGTSIYARRFPTSTE
jgi:hypothetical protein